MFSGLWATSFRRWAERSVYEDQLNALMLLHEDEARKQVTELGFTMLVANRDGRECVMSDWKPERLNVVIRNGQVVEILGFG